MFNSTDLKQTFSTIWGKATNWWNNNDLPPNNDSLLPTDSDDTPKEKPKWRNYAEQAGWLVAIISSGIGAFFLTRWLFGKNNSQGQKNNIALNATSTLSRRTINLFEEFLPSNLTVGEPFFINANGHDFWPGIYANGTMFVQFIQDNTLVRQMLTKTANGQIIPGNLFSIYTQPGYFDSHNVVINKNTAFTTWSDYKDVFRHIDGQAVERITNATVGERFKYPRIFTTGDVFFSGKEPINPYYNLYCATKDGTDIIKLTNNTDLSLYMLSGIKLPDGKTLILVDNHLLPGSVELRVFDNQFKQSENVQTVGVYKYMLDNAAIVSSGKNRLQVIDSFYKDHSGMFSQMNTTCYRLEESNIVPVIQKQINESEIRVERYTSSLYLCKNTTINLVDGYKDGEYKTYANLVQFDGENVIQTKFFEIPEFALGSFYGHNGYGKAARFPDNNGKTLVVRQKRNLDKYYIYGNIVNTNFITKDTNTNNVVNNLPWWAYVIFGLSGMYCLGKYIIIPLTIVSCVLKWSKKKPSSQNDHAQWLTLEEIYNICVPKWSKKKPSSQNDHAQWLKLEETYSINKNDAKLLAKMMKDFKHMTINVEDIKCIAMIGAGGGGAVIYKAIWNNTGVAYKVFNIQNLGSESNITEFGKEITAMQQLNHPNIIQFFGVVFNKEKFGLVMEYIDTGDLKKLIASKKPNGESMLISWKDRASIIFQILLGVSAIHAKNIAHRDLKPENIMVLHIGDTFHPKIIDFGYTKKIGRDQQHTKRIGTAAYMAPEVVSSDEDNFDPIKADCFSVGMIFFALIVLRRPYKGSNRRNIEYAVATNKLWESIPENACHPTFAKITDGLRERDPKNRMTIPEAFGFFKQHRKEIEDFPSVSITAQNDENVYRYPLKMK